MFLWDLGTKVEQSLAFQGDDDFFGEDLDTFDKLSYQHSLFVVVELLPEGAECLQGIADLL